MKISACIVLYNPKDMIFENINSYYDNIDFLVVVDNSDKKNDFIYDKLNTKFHNKLIYISFDENLGIAKALNVACLKSIELGCDWILTMDQDSRFINFYHYIKCLEAVQHNNNIALLTGNTARNALSMKKEKESFDFEERFIVITSGNFVNLSLYQQIGGYDDKLFIDMVDYDFCAKIKMKGFKILYFEDVLIEHAIGEVHARKNILSGKVRYKIEHNHQRAYYIARNSLYLAKKYHKVFPHEFGWIKTINILFIHEVTKILLYEHDKLKKIKAKFIGAWHFVINRFGKNNLDF